MTFITVKKGAMSFFTVKKGAMTFFSIKKGGKDIFYQKIQVSLTLPRSGDLQDTRVGGGANVAPPI